MSLMLRAPAAQIPHSHDGLLCFWVEVALGSTPRESPCAHLPCPPAIDMLHLASVCDHWQLSEAMTCAAVCLKSRECCRHLLRTL